MSSFTLTPLAEQLYHGPGLNGFGVHTVVKFGGSLLRDVAVARTVGTVLIEADAGCPMAVFPGGGPTDKLIESIAVTGGLADTQINPACMRALDQTGLLLAALVPGIEPVETMAQLRLARARGALPVLLPSALILSLDVFTRQNVITSDTLGAYFAFLLGARRYVVLTDVDGVYHGFDGGFDGGRRGELIARCTPQRLSELGATSVDQCLGPFLAATRMPTWVLNGHAPQRLVELISGGAPVGTRIEAGDCGEPLP